MLRNMALLIAAIAELVLVWALGKETAVAFAEPEVRPKGSGQTAVPSGAIARFPAQEKTVATVCFGPDGKRLACRTEGATIRIWDVSTRDELKAIDCPWSSPWIGQGTVMTFSSDGTKLIAFGAQEQSPRGPSHLRCWDLKSDKSICSFVVTHFAFSGSASTLAISPDGTVAAVIAEDIEQHRIRSAGLWSLASQELLHSHRGEHDDEEKTAHGPLGVAFSPDNRLLAIAECAVPRERDHIELIDWPTWTHIRGIHGHSWQTEHVAFSPGGQFLVTWGRDFVDRTDKIARIRVLEAMTGTVISEWDAGVFNEEGTTGLHALALSPNGRIIATSLKNDIQLWDLLNGAELGRLKGHEGEIMTIAFSPDGRSLASGGVDKTVLLWDVSKIQPKHFAATASEKLPGLWDGLEQRDAGKAYKSMLEFVGGGDVAVDLLAKQLRPVAKPQAEQISKLFASLDDEVPQVRRQASQKLVDLGWLVVPGITDALKTDVSAEARKRLTDALEEIVKREVSDSELRDRRAVLALELIGTDKAKKLLQTLVEGAQAAPLTREARSGLDRTPLPRD